MVANGIVPSSAARHIQERRKARKSGINLLALVALVAFIVIHLEN